jgi:dipeptidase E
MDGIDTNNRHILLISTSTLYGGGYLDHAEAEIRHLLGPLKRILFVPYALYDRNAYAALAKRRFDAMGYDLRSVHEVADAQQAIRQTEAVFIGGGNTFRLLKALYDLDLLLPIRHRVTQGMPYIGSSAGSNVSCPTIKTTNDMPIVQPPSFDALSLVSFQINPHYQDPDPASTHMGETREERINQYLEENVTPVVGLREGAMLRVGGGSIVLKGVAGARIFRRGHSPVETETGSELNELISTPDQGEI